MPVKHIKINEEKTENKEKFRVVLTDNSTGENYYYLLTQDQINLLQRLCESDLLEYCDYIIIENENWIEI